MGGLQEFGFGGTQEGEKDRAWPPPRPGKRLFQPGWRWADGRLCCCCRWVVRRRKGERELRPLPETSCRQEYPLTLPIICIYVAQKGGHHFPSSLLCSQRPQTAILPATPYPQSILPQYESSRLSLSPYTLGSSSLSLSASSSSPPQPLW